MYEIDLIYEIENFRIWEDRNPIIVMGEKTLKQVFKKVNEYSEIMVEDHNNDIQYAFYGCIVKISEDFNYGFILR
jgi:hypothetical protein